MHKVLVMGDSHVAPWREIQRAIPIEGYKFKVVSTPGASAFGVNKDISGSNSNKRFAECLSRWGHESEYIIISLGEIDCGSLAWIYMHRHNEVTDPKEVIDMSIVSIKRYVQETVSVYFNPDKIILQSVNIPTVSPLAPVSNVSWHDYGWQNADRVDTSKPASLVSRKGITANLRQRTDMVHYYNNNLKLVCKQLGIHYLDTTTDTITSEGVIDPMYIKQLKHDYHLSIAPAGRLFKNKFIELLDVN